MTLGERVFAHISTYTGRGRPDSNRQVVYSVGRDDKGRPRAGRFQYAGAAHIGAGMAPGVWVAGAVVSVFFACLAGLFYLGYLPVTVPGSGLAFCSCLALSLSSSHPVNNLTQRV